MLRDHKLPFITGLVILLIALAFSLNYFFNNEGRSSMNETGKGTLKLSSPAFKNGEAIPPQYTCKGQNVNPPLNIIGVPSEAKSVALIMHDPDAVGQDFVHWLMWDIPTTTTSIGISSVPVGAVQGVNGAGANSYTGPCPPAGSGTHRYMFELYALDKTLNLTQDTDRAKLESVISSHTIDQTTLMGLFAAD